MTDKPANLLATVSPGTEDHIDACLAVARELPQYFTEQGIATMSQDLRIHLLYIARNLNEVLGFAAVNRKNSRVAELSWIAVKREHHHQGIGSELMGHIVENLRSQEIIVLEVKTLSADVDYPSYEKTRRFYEKNGFIHLDTIDPYPGWEPGSPCAIYVKIL